MKVRKKKKEEFKPISFRDLVVKSNLFNEKEKNFAKVYDVFGTDFSDWMIQQEEIPNMLDYYNYLKDCSNPITIEEFHKLVK